jgi:NAD(P)-dependent dehydrogenase (short-subunit alcohol dehydrogenase family)
MGYDVAQSFNFQGSAAAVTGAASGIGRALALALAARGADVAICDVNEAGLRSLAQEIGASYGRQVLVRRVDVSDAAQVNEFAAATVQIFPRLNLLINNAGVALLGDFDEIDPAQMQWLMGINFWGVVQGTRAFLPHLARQEVAHIVNLSSIFGIIAPPGQCAYAAAKFAVRGFSEALRHELKQKGSAVRLTVVHPGGVDTDIARSAQHGASLREQVSADDVGARFKQMARTSPVQAAQLIIRAIERNQPRVLIGGDARVLDFIQRLRPATYWQWLARSFERIANQAAGGTPQ